jgi:hypothetical protein
VLFIFIACVRWPQLWDWFGVFHIRPYFADLVAVLAASDAHASGLDPYGVPSPLDPFGRPHVYGPWWLYLHYLGVGLDNASVLGAILAVISIAAFAWCLRPRGIEQVIAAILLLASPPLLLAYERGNNDLVVALLLLVAGASGGRSLIWSNVFVILAAALKFYPVVGLVTLLKSASWRQAVMAGLFSVMALGLVGWIWRADFVDALGYVPRSESLYGYGLKLTRLVVGSAPSGLHSSIYVLVAASVAGFVSIRGAQRSNHLDAMAAFESRTGGWFVVAGTCWVFCYLVIESYPYRAVLIAVSASAWFQLWSSREQCSRSLGRLLVWTCVTMLFCRPISLLLYWLTGQPFGIAAMVVFGFEHGAVLGLSAVMVIAVMRLAANRILLWKALVSA